MLSDTTVELEPRLSHRVRTQAGQFSPGATLLDILLAPFWLAGWVVFWVLLFLTEAGRLGFAAVQVGWQDARARAQARQVATDRWPVRPRKPKARHGGPG